MRVILSLLLTMAGAQTVGAGVDPAEVDLRAAIPADAVFVVMTDDAPGLVDRWAETPLARMWADPQMKRFFAPLREDLEIDRWNEQAEEKTGYTVDELVDFFSGEAVIFMPAMEPEPEEEATLSAPDEDPDLVLLADIGERADDFEELLLKLDESSEEEREEADEGFELTRITREYRDATMHIDLIGDDEDGEESDSWTVFGSTFAITSSPEMLEAVIDATLDGGAPDPLADSDAFQSVAGQVVDSDLFLYLNLDQVMPLIRAEMVRDSAPEEGRPGPPIPPELVFDALALDVLQAGFAAVNLDGGTIGINGGVTFSEDRGLVKALAYLPGEVPRPQVIPGDAYSFGAAAFDFEAAWTGVEEIFNAANPAMLAMAGAQIKVLAENAGVELDLRRDLLENLGTEVFVAETPLALANADQDAPIAAQSQVFGVQIRQRQGLELAIETLKGMAAQGSELFRTREFLGTQIHTAGSAASTAADDPAAAGSFSYALTDQLLLVGIGSPSALEAVLVKLQKPGASVWERDEVREALAGLPAGAAGLQYQDLAATGHKLFAMLAFIASTAEDEDLIICDAGAVPAREAVATYLGAAVSGFYKDGSKILVRMRLLPAGDVHE